MNVSFAISHPALANDAVGVALVAKSTATLPAKLDITIARPKAAGLKIFCPKPPNTNLPKKIAKIVLTANA